MKTKKKKRKIYLLQSTVFLSALVHFNTFYKLLRCAPCAADELVLPIGGLWPVFDRNNKDVRSTLNVLDELLHTHARSMIIHAVDDDDD